MFMMVMGSSCESLTPAEDYLTFDTVGIEEYVEELSTKAAPLTAVPSFYCWAYPSASTNFNSSTASYMAKETFSQYSGATFRSALKHGAIPSGTYIKYWAVGPTTASGLAFPATGTTWSSATLGYQTPADAASQSDVVVASPTYVNGSAATASMAFSHILCQVRIHTAFDNVPAGSVSTVTLTNVGYNGTYRLSTGTWTSVSGTRNMTFTASQTLTTASENVQIGTDAQAFMLIPQTLSSSCNLQVRVGSTTYTKSMSGVVLTAGRRVTLRITFSANSISTPNDTDNAEELSMDVAIQYE